MSKERLLLEYKGKRGYVKEQISDNLAVVEFEDGSELLLPVIDQSCGSARKKQKEVEKDPLKIIDTICVINEKFMKKLAQKLYECGVYNMTLSKGKIVDLNLYETLELKKIRLRKEAEAGADKKAEEEFQNEETERDKV